MKLLNDKEAQCKFPLFPSFLVSVIYSKAKLASACGGIIYFLSYVPYMYVAIREEVAHDKITAFEKCIAVRLFLFFPIFSFESNYI